jgi:hypothetical protein
MRRLQVFCAALTVAGMLWSPAAGASSPLAVLPVTYCHTVFGIGAPPRSIGKTVTVRSSSPTAGLAAYSNSHIYLLGPRGLTCSGTVAADGGEQVIAWAKGHPKPTLHSRGIGLTLTIDPACAGCRADAACPFLRAFAKSLGFPCTAGVPAGERIVQLPHRAIAFEDPPGVAGSGWPSGGPDPANGVVGFTPGLTAGVYRSTCTLPASPAPQVCTTVLNDVISRYG